MHFDELTPPEQRVLGCLIEKRWTTPDQYPLSLNGLRLACNQATNRDPVTDYDESTVRAAAQRLSRYGLARLASGHGSRAVKYRHLAEEALSLGRQELAVLSVLLLRGPQTPGELKARSERMAAIGSLAETEAVLRTLGDRGYARRLDRRPGQKEDRFEHLLGPASGEPIRADGQHVGDELTFQTPSPVPATPQTPSPVPATPQTPSPVPATPPALDPSPVPATPPALDRGQGGLADRVSALEAEVTALRAELTALRAELTALRDGRPHGQPGPESLSGTTRPAERSDDP